MILDWQWIGKDEALQIHELQIERFGGSRGIRDEGLLESALARPINLHQYQGEEEVVRLAASYAFGLARNHPFVDGNKRTAFVVCALFLELCGRTMIASQSDVVKVVLGLADGSVSEDEFAEWLRGASAPREA